MAINKKLVHFKTFAKFNEELSAGNILETSICWIKDTKQIWTHGQFYDCSSLTDEDIVRTALVGYTESVETNENLDLTAEDTIVGAFGKLVKAIKDNEEVDSAAFVKLRDSIGLDENLGFSTSAGDTDVTEAIERIDRKIISTGDGTKFLADNGQYLVAGRAVDITDIFNRLVNLPQPEPQCTDEDYNALKEYALNGVVTYINNNNDTGAVMHIKYLSGTITIEAESSEDDRKVVLTIIIEPNKLVNMESYYIPYVTGVGKGYLGLYTKPSAYSAITKDDTISEAIGKLEANVEKIITSGNGTKFLSDDGRYKEVDATSVTDERIVGSTIVGYTESVETGAGLDLAQDDTIIEAFGKLSKSIKDNKSDASSTFATKEELNAKADSTAIADMATKTWVGQQGYLTEHQDISDLATKTELISGLSGKQDKGNYALKSEIPNVSSFITKEVNNLSNYYTKTNVDSKLSGKSDTSHTHTNAAQSVNGFMSSTDKAKLDGIAAGANNYIHPTSSGNKHIPSGGSSGQILRWSADGTAVWGNDNNTTYSQATPSVLGLVKIGYTENGKNYPVELSNGQMFVNVPWTDTKYSLSSFGITATATELNYCDGVTSNIQNQLNAKLASDYYTGHSTTSSYTIPTNKRLCIATLSTSGSLNVGSISDGRELHIIVKNSSSSKITITFPSSGYVKLSGDTLDVEAGAYAEINIISDGTTKYIRAISN